MDTNNKIDFTRSYCEIDWSRLGRMHPGLLENKKINYIISPVYMYRGRLTNWIEKWRIYSWILSAFELIQIPSYIWIWLVIWFLIFKFHLQIICLNNFVLSGWDIFGKERWEFLEKQMLFLLKRKNRTKKIRWYMQIFFRNFFILNNKKNQ